ncbi:hypothetical protein J1780_04675 [Rahnella aceris]|uniref:hypothetical protein n=1 Tax=Rahnella sp. (strain Y9602) TaxID=2703885 RepID=UPI001C26C4A5|nr:hypothetical protein [Rahnella aceris]MBU9839248.1 hypothetical protein [Rahnella aceris]
MNARMVAVQQRNHDNWYLHSGLPSQAGRSLCQLGSVISRDNVACTFSICPLRTADVMTYLINDRSDIVTFEQASFVWERSPGGDVANSDDFGQ